MSEDTILREVDEELRGDRLRALWRQLGPWLIAAAVLVVLAVAVNEGWRWWQTTTAANASDQFYNALELAEGSDIAAAQDALNAVIASGTNSYPTLARFRQASLLARDGRTEEAVAAYDALASTETSERLRELALIMAANLMVDSGDVAAVQQRVGGLVSPDKAMRNVARETIGLAQYRAGDLDAALKSFEEAAADPLVGNEARSRLQIFIAQLTAEGAGASVPAAGAEAAAPAAGDEAPATGEEPATEEGAQSEGEPSAN